MHLELWTFKSLGVSFNVQSISQCCTHRAKMSLSLNSRHLAMGWPQQLGNCHNVRSTKMTWCSQLSWACLVSPWQPPQPWSHSQRQIQMRRPLMNSGKSLPRWLLDSHLVFRKPTPLPQSFFLLHHSLWYQSVFFKCNLALKSLGSISFLKYNL